MYVDDGVVKRTLDEQIYLISALRINSQCGGMCGYHWNAKTSPHWRADLNLWRGEGYEHHWVGGGGDTASGEQRGQLVCTMPKFIADRMVGFHQNCLAGSGSMLPAKRANMLSWRNWTVEDIGFPEIEKAWMKVSESLIQAPHTGDGHRHPWPRWPIVAIFLFLSFVLYVSFIAQGSRFR
jgi:hypothetical protein